MGRNKTKPFFPDVEIVDVGAEGKAIGKVDDMVVFVTNVVPGDVVDLQVTKKRKRYCEAKVTQIKKRSALRVDPFCDHFGVCGGCKWQNLPYEAQLQYKQKQVADQLSRIGKLDLPEISPIIGSVKTKEYRNKLEYTFSNKRWLTIDEINDESVTKERGALGFHIPGLFDKVLDIDKCWLQAEPSNEIRNVVKEHALKHGLDFFDIKTQEGFLRNLIIRSSSTGELMVILSFFREEKENREELLSMLAERFPQITSLMYVINPKGNDTIFDLDIQVFKGNDCMYEQMENLRFKVGPKSFYQTNTEQAYNLYKVAREYAQLTGNETVYDLYTGTGTIANFVAHKAKKVIGIEYVPEAIDDAKINSSINGISNTSFFAGDMKDILTDSFIKKHGNPDVIITDPPRAGMDLDVVNTILAATPKKIVYVSCNPATQARDLELMKEQYQIAKIQPVDMFPHTHHVENVVLLEKKETNQE